MSETSESKNETASAPANPSAPHRRMLLLIGALLLCGLFIVQMFREGMLWFNMPSRRKYPVRGVDASHYQGQMDWQTIAGQGITFAFLKATEGSGTVDDCFAENWKNARAAGLAVGAYHFFSFDSPAETQADNYCAVVPASEDALPPVIDLEYYRSDSQPDVNTVRKELRTMLERHLAETGSPRAKTILENWEETLPLFKKILPNDYRRMLAAITRREERGIPREQAELDAFNAVQRGEE